ncbi:hypothetical protein [Tropicimonas sp. IMCC6043]|uniref:hypothetical protein n=1 Tax=Tropicimonas sp. IMCC6043 TaxID=2510645 RepID=UPI00101DFE27|nr:hypothetical protein [Tropicimonas sp. IMCC6043]RYH06469.1 hypothetical protein EU800_23765 [Tropicimonas sp. IMCC6043]
MTDVAPVASFSDFYGSYCRVQTQKLAEIEERSSVGINVLIRPLLGPESGHALDPQITTKEPAE